MLGIDCSVLQCVAVRCSVLRHGPGVPCIGDASFGARKVSHTHATSRLCCSVLQCVAVCCSVLHCGPGASCMGDGSFGGRKVLPWINMKQNEYNCHTKLQVNSLKTTKLHASTWHKMKQLPFIHQRKIEFIPNYSLPPCFSPFCNSEDKVSVNAIYTALSRCFALSLFFRFHITTRSLYEYAFSSCMRSLSLSLSFPRSCFLFLSLSLFLSVSVSPFCSLTPPNPTPTLLLTPPPLSPLRSLRPPCVLPPLLQSQMQEGGDRVP